MRALKGINSAGITQRYMKNEQFRIGLGIRISMAVNFVYAAVNLVSGVTCSSVWLGASGIYFLLLGIIRAVLSHAYEIKDREGGFEFERKQYKITAWLLFALNIPMGYMIIMLIEIETETVYPMYTIYAVAAYTFYKLTASIINLIKYRHTSSPVLSAIKALSFIAALMSLTALQDAMIFEFSQNSRYFRERMNTFTGTTVYALVIAITVYMVFHSLNLIGDGDYE